MSSAKNSTFKVGLVQMRSGVDPQTNLATALAAVEEAARAGAAYVLTPEMTNIMETKRDRLFAAIADEERDPTLTAMRETARKLALAEGKALQLTNILRDLVEDAARGRLYLPRELLEKHGIGASDPRTVLGHPDLGKACDDLAAIARASYTEAAAWLAQLDRRRMRPAVIMLEVYRRKLDGLVARGWRELEGPVGPSKLTKLWIALRHGFF